MDDKPTLLIPLDLAQQIADYLGQRPFNDVAPIMARLARLEPAPAPPAPGAGMPARNKPAP